MCFNVNTNTNFVLAYQTQQKSSLKKIVIRHSRAAPSYLLMALRIYLTLKRTGTKIITPFPANCQLIHADLKLVQVCPHFKYARAICCCFYFLFF